MNLHDIIQADDHIELMGLGERLASYIPGITYMGMTSLEELKDTLEAGNRARLYLVDNNFYRFRHGQSDSLAEESIDLIRTYHPEANIVIMSMSKMDILARKKNVGYIPKGLMTSDMAARVEQALGTY